MSRVCADCQRPLDRAEEWRLQVRQDDDLLDADLCFNCRDERLIKLYEDTGVIRTNIAASARLDQWRADHGQRRQYGHVETMTRMAASLERIRAKILEFEREVWFAGLRNGVRSAIAKEKEYQVTHTSFAFSYLVDGEKWHGLIRHAQDAFIGMVTSTETTDSWMSLDCIGATEEQALAAIDATIAGWRFRNG